MSAPCIFSRRLPCTVLATPFSFRRPFRERGSEAFINKFLDVFCRAYLSCRRSFYTSKRDQRGSRLEQAHHLGLCLHRRSTRCIRARAFPRPGIYPEYGPSWMPAHLGVFCRMRAARSSYQSYCEEVRTLVVHPARIDVLSICLHDLYTVCARASQRSIRVGLRAKRSLFCRRRMGSRRTA